MDLLQEMALPASMGQNVPAMWRSLRDLFSSIGRSSEEGDHAADTKLRQLWFSLVRLGIARGLKFPDAEDLAQDSIIAGIESFDAGRGDFGTFCRKIMANKTKNFHRDTRLKESIFDDGGKFVDLGIDASWDLYYRQCRERTDRIVTDTMSSLEKSEAEFLLVLAEVHEELSHGEVSEAARRAGISPQKGWDMFRKIQRRFRDLDSSLLIPEPPPRRVADGTERQAIVERHLDFTERPTPPPSDIASPEGSFFRHIGGQYWPFRSHLDTSALRKLRIFFAK